MPAPQENVSKIYLWYSITVFILQATFAHKNLLYEGDGLFRKKKMRSQQINGIVYFRIHK